jgi:hypothetical protein
VTQTVPRKFSEEVGELLFSALLLIGRNLRARGALSATRHYYDAELPKSRSAKP